MITQDYNVLKRNHLLLKCAGINVFNFANKEQRIFVS